MMGEAMSRTGLQLASMPHERDVVLTIGTFDGVHLGHQHLVRQVVRRSQERRCLSGAVTFHPHPRAVVTGDGPPYLVCLDERLAKLRRLGLDIVTALPFTRDLARLSALEFMNLLCESVRLRELWIGAGFTLGHCREGTVARLTEIGHELGFQVHTVPPLLFRGWTVSSTLIREIIGRGQVEAAAHLLARRHHISGIAMPGDQGEHRLGLSTVAVVVSDGLAVPASGVYVGRVRSGDKQWSALVHVEPHRAGTPRRLQASVSDFPDDLFGRSLQVQFVRRLRAGTPVQTARAPMDRTLARRQMLSFAPAGS
jgi:riboflavin kinase/FMN adenylyltransferase